MLIQLSCLIKACDRLGFVYAFFDDNQNGIIVDTPKGKLWFVNSAVSINLDTDNNIAQDKYFTYKLLSKDVRMPFSTCYVDPFIREQYSEYITLTDYSLITKEITRSHKFPCIVKSTRQTHGINVLLCQSRQEVTRAVKMIFNPKSKDYDYTVLAQEYIKPHHEFRLVALDGKIQFMYEKDTTDAQFNGNISPLHWENARAKLVDDRTIISDFQKFVDPIFKTFPIRFAGLDVIVDENNQKYLIEVNSRPGFANFMRDNGEDEVIKLYENVLQR
ncbi:hypothetical protein A2690_03515 [Candidatus Roizmanbacteria bacterium RIFCSPHIGHO2_01_FULL_39_12b]|uniref:ATP-grasp domain-containing protein n=1 Tax=Candidatus Roizmanbacteria bacterium RIFCSPHIGHO2_01_FULL_39_12b TaxID=1802030 RepID=A0A1F7GD74_9BACT|nr:MAG: hypothetical protein A2690_03515 [Candidatus Roizmanbacteria bacterium RIFCSPHIGHO2_01_FULL_39_12b]